MLLSLDISTSCVGYSVFSEKHTLLELDFIRFNSKQNIFEKLDSFKKKIFHLTKLPITAIAIEEPLEKFEGKYSTSHTIAILNFFNGMISSYLFSEFKIEPVYFNATHARTKAIPWLKIERSSKKETASTKHQVWEKVVNMEPQINWKYGIKSRKLSEENYDMADSYIIGRCYIETFKEQQEKLKNNI